ncbi:MAG: hypothetical protein ISS70_19660 [Phycisphaerae bacterium]|nr:hypothetical protein [Phycisphaerae bacterium]
MKKNIELVLVLALLLFASNSFGQPTGTQPVEFKKAHSPDEKASGEGQSPDCQGKEHRRSEERIFKRRGQVD